MSTQNSSDCETRTILRRQQLPELRRRPRYTDRCGHPVGHWRPALGNRDPFRQACDRARSRYRGRQTSRDRPSASTSRSTCRATAASSSIPARCETTGPSTSTSPLARAETLTSSTATTTRSWRESDSRRLLWSRRSSRSSDAQARQRPEGPFSRVDSWPECVGSRDQPAGAGREKVAHLQAGEGRSRRASSAASTASPRRPVERATSSVPELSVRATTPTCPDTREDARWSSLVTCCGRFRRPTPWAPTISLAFR